MAEQIKIQVEIMGVGQVTTLGEIWLSRWSKRERLGRGLKFLAISWLLALGAVFIPVLHFILVPLFVLAGPILYFLVVSQTEGYVGGQGICPHCGELFKIVITRESEYWDDLCNICKKRVQVRRPDLAAKRA